MTMIITLMWNHGRFLCVLILGENSLEGIPVIVAI